MSYKGLEGCYSPAPDVANINRLRCFQMPIGTVGDPEWALDLSYELPSKAKDAGLMLLDVLYNQPPYGRKDPYIIFDINGRILHAWPDNYIPGPFEIERVAMRLVDEK
jgi:hypothetical protein